MGDIEYGTCEICGLDSNLERKYFYYDVKCNCHSPSHFELVRHCSQCIPLPPKSTVIFLTPKDKR